MNIDLLKTPHGEKLNELIKKRKELVKKNKLGKAQFFTVLFATIVLILSGIKLFKINSENLVLPTSCFVIAVAFLFLKFELPSLEKQIAVVDQEILQEKQRLLSLVNEKLELD